MPNIQPWETELILWLRTALPGLMAPFEVLTSFGGEIFFLVLLPLLYWSFDRGLGARVTVLYLLSTYINGVSKHLFDMPRPLDDEILRLAGLFPEGVEVARERYGAVGSGFPSGHTQSTLVVWGYLAGRVRRARLRITSAAARLIPLLLAAIAVLIVLVPLSRIYLAVHYPRDIIGGYLWGVTVLAFFAWLSPAIEARLDRLSLKGRLIVAAGLPLLAALAVADEITTTASAALLGMGVGFVLERRWVGFSAEGSAAERAAGSPWVLRFSARSMAA